MKTLIKILCLSVVSISLCDTIVFTDSLADTITVNNVKITKINNDEIHYTKSLGILGNKTSIIKKEKLISYTSLNTINNKESISDEIEESISNEIEESVSDKNKLFINNPLDWLLPSKINSSVETNYSINNNDFEFLETMTYSIKCPRLLHFFSIKPKSGIYVATMNKLKKNARKKYGDNIGFVNVVSTERNNLTPTLVGELPFLLFMLWYNEEVIISADIIRFTD